MSTVDRPSNEVLELLNRFYYSKLSGAYTKHEYSSLVVKVGDLIANDIKNGKITNQNVIDEIIQHLPNENFFKNVHEGIKEANKSVEESLEMAAYERVNRFSKGLKM